MLILKGHKEPVQSVAFSPDGETLLSMDRSDHVRLWGLPAGGLRWKLDDAFYTSVAFTPDGKQVLTCDREGASPTMWGDGRPRSEFDQQNPIQVRDVSTGEAARAPIQDVPKLPLFGLT